MFGKSYSVYSGPKLSPVALCREVCRLKPRVPAHVWAFIEDSYGRALRLVKLWEDKLCRPTENARYILEDLLCRVQEGAGPEPEKRRPGRPRKNPAPVMPAAERRTVAPVVAPKPVEVVELPKPTPRPLVETLDLDQLPAPKPAALNWTTRAHHGRDFNECDRFTVKSDENQSGHVVYDRTTKRHHRGFMTAASAREWCERVAAGVEKPRRVILVSCSAEKCEATGKPIKAADLYTSPLFKKARRYAEAAGCPWFILSAKFGLLDPNETTDGLRRPLAPYDVKLTDLTPEQRAKWAGDVRFSLWAKNLLGGVRVEVHAGRGYVEPLAELLDLEEPLKGLEVGQRLKWYNDRV